jgi:hypothetical protein
MWVGCLRYTPVAFPQGKRPCTNPTRGGWAWGPVYTGPEWTPDRPLCSEPLYQSRQPWPQFVSIRTECLLNQLIPLLFSDVVIVQLIAYRLLLRVQVWYFGCLLIWFVTYKDDSLDTYVIQLVNYLIL